MTPYEYIAIPGNIITVFTSIVYTCISILCARNMTRKLHPALNIVSVFVLWDPIMVLCVHVYNYVV